MGAPSDRTCASPHHFVGAASCRWGLTTWTSDGGIMISSVGEYFPDPTGPMQTIGAGPAFYETMVFRCDPESTPTDCGHPQPMSWSEVDSERYATVLDANAGHWNAVERWEPTA